MGIHGVSLFNSREWATYDPERYARDMRGICAACTLGPLAVLESRLWEPQALSAKESMETHGYTWIRLSVTQKFATIPFWNVAPTPRKPPIYVMIQRSESQGPTQNIGMLGWPWVMPIDHCICKSYGARRWICHYP